MSERLRALNLLDRIELTQSFATPLLVNESDLVRTYVLGVLRWRSQLDFLIAKLSSRAATRIDVRVLQILRLGIFELRFMHSAAYAAVDGTVELAKLRAGRASGFVNAVLRSATRTGDLSVLLPIGDKPAAVAVRWAHPEWIIERWNRQFGAARAEGIAAANQQLSFPDLLINVSRISVEKAHALLTEREVKFSPSNLVPGMVRLEESTEKVAGEIREGLFYPMDEGSGLVAALLASEESGSAEVLDLAAAPGGKSFFLRSRGVRVLSSDLSFGRMMLVKRTARRMFESPARMLIADASATPFRRRFDSVLLDAPCSATGTLRKSPELKWRITPAIIEDMSRLQETLLHQALDLTARQCLYATCSLEDEENGGLVQRVLAARGDFRLTPIEQHAAAPTREWIREGRLQLTPEAGTDGFGAALLTRI